MGECLQRSFASRPFAHLWFFGSFWIVAGDVAAQRPPRRLVRRRSRGSHDQRSGGQALDPCGQDGDGSTRAEWASQRQPGLPQVHHRQPERQAGGIGITTGPGSPASFIVNVEERDTGRKVDYREFGDPHSNSPRGSITITNLVCDVRFADSQGRISLAPQQSFGMLQGFRRIYRMPAGETLESYLKNNQWNAVKGFVARFGLPYFIARAAEGVAMLPGTTDLNALK
jgi:hypothetical protein